MSDFDDRRIGVVGGAAVHHEAVGHRDVMGHCLSRRSIKAGLDRLSCNLQNPFRLAIGRNQVWHSARRHQCPLVIRGTAIPFCAKSAERSPQYVVLRAMVHRLLLPRVDTSFWRLLPSVL
jgi:hypothetical protein